MTDCIKKFKAALGKQGSAEVKTLHVLADSTYKASGKEGLELAANDLLDELYAMRGELVTAIQVEIPGFKIEEQAERVKPVKVEAPVKQPEVFVATHETSDGTPVMAVLDDAGKPVKNQWLDKDGNEIEDRYATAIETAPVTGEIAKTTEATDIKSLLADTQAKLAEQEESGAVDDRLREKERKLRDAVKAEFEENPASTYGQSNKLFTEDAAAKARELLRKKLGQLNAGIDPEVMQAGIVLAGYHVEAGARKFTEFAQAMVKDLGDGIKPYLKSLYVAIHGWPGMDNAGMTATEQLTSEYVDMALNVVDMQAKSGAIIESTGDITNVNDKRSNADLEQDSGNGNAENTVGSDAVQPGRSGDTGSDREGIQPAGEPGNARGGRKRLSGYEAAVAGKRGDFSPYSESEEPGSAAGITGDLFGERSGDSGLEGIPVESIPAETVSQSATTSAQLSDKRAAQAAAQGVKVETGDLSNIAESLPFLTHGQQSDVLVAETRFSKPDGYGMLFTNGTGTGKTGTGLGVIKRYERQGKTNILIAVPSDSIMKAWIDFAKHLQLDITPLENTKSNGKGIVITTYANLGENRTLADRNWDLVVTDESHKLMQAGDGKATGALDTLRAITNHPRGVYNRAAMLYRKEYDAIMAAKEEESALLKDKAPKAALDKVHEKLSEAYKAFEVKREIVKADVAASQGAKRTRALFLSATPFAYEKTIDYAEGYLFSYGEADGSAYNSGGGFERFMMMHFGYRMRYNKLTQPEKEVDSGLMQRMFNSFLKKEGVLSGRMLEVDHDYDRKFVLTENAIGTKIDEGLEWLWENKRYYPLHELIRKRFDHLGRRYLLEAIKAKEVIPQIEQHLALGRKVVVFHDFKKGGASNPFDFSAFSGDDTLTDSRNAAGEIEQVALSDLIDEFNNLRPDLVRLPVSRLNSPIVALKKAFPDLLLFNGGETKNDRRAAVEQFNSDDSGKNVILVQSAAGREGISLHDTTGKHSRVLFNLGLPTQPITAIQQEGRIFRVGQSSDAMFRYLNTGTNWERFAFADTVARRSSTAENLALGEQARALLDGFIQAYEESDEYPAGHEGEGKGGKERDAAANAVLTEWDRAISMYFSNQKKTSRTKAQEGADYFATPEPLGLKMVEWANPRPGDNFLEPSAGHGAIARWFPELSERTAVEPSSQLASRLKMATDAKVLQENFEDFNTVNKFDVIVMNPPFGSGGKTAIDHLAKASKHLRDGGRIVALIPNGPATDKKFEKWFYGEEVRKAAPLGSTQRVGSYYVGDIATIDGRSGKYRIEGSGDAGVEMSPVNGGMQEAWRSHYLITVTPGPRTETYRPADNLYLAADIQLPTVTFERAGTKVSAHVVVIEKQTDKELAKGIQQQNRDYSEAGNINEFFERIQDSSIRDRVKPVQTEQEEVATKPTGKAAVVTPAKGEGFSGVVEGKHTQTGAPIFTVTLNERVSKDEYSKLSDAAKKTGGYWSRFTKGFMFKDDANGDKARAFSEGLNQPNAGVQEDSAPEPGHFYSKDSRTNKRPAKSVTTARLTEIVTKLRTQNAGLQGVTIHIRETQAQAFGAESVKRDGIIKGGYYAGSDSLVLIAENIVNDADAIMVMRHELVGHFGLRQLLGDKFDDAMDRVYAARNGELKDLYDWVADAYPDLIKENNESKIADEMFARASETRRQSTLLDRIYEAIIKLLHTLGLTRGPVSRRELHALIQLSARNLQRKTADTVALDRLKPAYRMDDLPSTKRLLSMTEKRKLPGFLRPQEDGMQVETDDSVMPWMLKDQASSKAYHGSPFKNGEPVSQAGRKDALDSMHDDQANAGEFDATNPDIRFSRAGNAIAAIDKHSKGAAETIKTFVKRNFTKEGLTNTETFENRLEMDAEKNVAEHELSFMVAGFEKDLADAYTVKYNDIATPDLEAVNAYLAGDRGVTLPTGLPAKLDVMRAYLDRLSGGMQEAMVDMMKIEAAKLSPSQAESFGRYIAGQEGGSLPSGMAKHFNIYQKIQDNKGAYLTRSYQAFDDINWKLKVLNDAGLMARARAFFAQENPDMTQAEIDGLIRNILQNAKDNGNFVSYMVKGSKLGSKDTSILMKKKDVPPIIRELLGEYKDPKINFVRSASKMQWFVANHHFLMKVRTDGMGTFLFENPTGEFDTELAGKGSETMNPLNGLYTSEEFRQGLEDASGAENVGDIMRELIRLNSMVKYGKTILSPSTQVRNFLSASFFSIMNGHFDWSHAVTAFKVAKADIFTKEAAWNDYLKEMIGLGVLHNNPYAGELKDAIADFVKLDIYKKGPFQKGRQLLDFMQRTYQVGDDFWKIIGFENEVALQVKAGAPLAQAKKNAAFRIRNGYPTYSMVPRGIKKLRRWPLIGTFVSFPYEIIRTSYNQVGFLADDIKAGKKQASAQRILGMSLAAGASYGLAVVSMMMAGMDDDDDEAVRKMLPPWSRNSQLIYTGYDQNGMPTYYDMSCLDPYTYIKKPLSAIMSGNNETVGKKLQDAFTEGLEPFIGVDIAAGVALEIASNKKEVGGEVFNPEAPPWDQAKSIMDHARKGLQPGFMSNAERIVLALNEATTHSGKQYNTADELLAVVGQRFGTLNIPQAMVYKGFEFSERKADSSMLLNYVSGSGERISDDQMRDATEKMLAARERVYRDMMKDTNAALKLGMDEDDLADLLSAAGVSSDDIDALLENEVPEWDMPADYGEKGMTRSMLTAVDDERRAEIEQEMDRRIEIIEEILDKQ